jgi:beta-mannosidase
MRKIIFVILFSGIISCNTLEKELPYFIEISKNWQFKAVDSLDWKAATVPGNIFTDLLTHKVIEDPFVKSNEEKVQWVSKKNWEYKTTFTLSAEIIN